MKVVCTANSGKALQTKYLIGYSQETTFHLTLGAEYIVFAFSVYRGSPMLLLAEDRTNLPNWYPVDLFSILDARVPQNWLSAAYTGSGEALQFLMGYERLISDESHYDGLLERIPTDLKAFREEEGKSE